MQVKHVVEKEDGSVVFQGVLSGEELAFVIEMGLETLIQAGAIPFTGTDRVDPMDIHDVPDMEQ